MTTEETELTFIHCPGCRSLIPAVANRCRMCGHTLKGEESVQESSAKSLESLQQRSRVRQRTLSVAGEELEHLKRQFDLADSTQEPASKEIVTPVAPTAKPVIVSTPRVPEYSRPARSESSPSINETVTPRPEPQPDQQRRARSRSVIDSIIQNVGQLEERLGGERRDNKAETVSEPAEKPVPPRTGNGRSDFFADDSAEEPGKKKRRRKRKRKRRNLENEEGVITEGGREVVDVEAKAAPLIARDEFRKEFREQAAPLAGKKEVEVFTKGLDKKVELKEEKEMEQVTRRETGFDGSLQKQLPQQERRRPTVAPSTELVGWFINYAGGKGVAIEIREGRFFIGSEHVKEADLVINHPTISAPHCLVRASSDGEGLKVQDLMSENGTFVKRFGETKYHPCFEAMQLWHGDWLKLGDYEMRICVVPIEEENSASKKEPKK